MEHLEEVNFEAFKPTPRKVRNQVDNMILQKEVYSYIKCKDL
jgi:hypothetical protein